MKFHMFTCILHLRFYGYIANSQGGQVPDGLKAQFLEHCTGIAEVMGWSAYRSPHLKNMNFHVFACMLHFFTNPIDG